VTAASRAAIATRRRIVLTGESCPYHDDVRQALTELGNSVVARELAPAGTGEDLRRDEPDLVVVVVGTDRASALHLIGAVRHAAKLPVVAASESGDEEWTVAAIAAGASAAVSGSSLESLHASVHAACERFSDLRRLEHAFEARAVIERAKGVLMASNGIAGDDAFALMRDHSRRTNRKLVTIADAILKSHVLLVRQRPDRAALLRAPRSDRTDGLQVRPASSSRSLSTREPRR
jgi:response regulator NasT